MDGFVALYLFMLAGITGYVLIANVPSILHTPLLSGSNFIHGVVLAGSMVVLGHAEGTLQLTLGFIAVAAATANVVGGYVVTDRMLAMFESSANTDKRRSKDADSSAESGNDDINDTDASHAANDDNGNSVS